MNANGRFFGAGVLGAVAASLAAWYAHSPGFPGDVRTQAQPRIESVSRLHLEPVSYKGALPPSKSLNTTAFDFQQCGVAPDFFSAAVSDQAIDWADCVRIAAFAAGAFAVVYLGAQVLRLVNRIDAWLDHASSRLAAGISFVGSICAAYSTLVAFVPPLWAVIFAILYSLATISQMAKQLFPGHFAQCLMTANQKIHDINSELRKVLQSLSTEAKQLQLMVAHNERKEKELEHKVQQLVAANEQIQTTLSDQKLSRAAEQQRNEAMQVTMEKYSDAYMKQEKLERQEEILQRLQARIDLLSWNKRLISRAGGAFEVRETSVAPTPELKHVQDEYAAACSHNLSFQASIWHDKANKLEAQIHSHVAEKEIMESRIAQLESEAKDRADTDEQTRIENEKLKTGPSLPETKNETEDSETADKNHEEETVRLEAEALELASLDTRLETLTTTYKRQYQSLPSKKLDEPTRQLSVQRLNADKERKDFIKKHPKAHAAVQAWRSAYKDEEKEKVKSELQELQENFAAYKGYWHNYLLQHNIADPLATEIVEGRNDAPSWNFWLPAVAQWHLRNNPTALPYVQGLFHSMHNVTGNDREAPQEGIYSNGSQELPAVQRQSLSAGLMDRLSKEELPSGEAEHAVDDDTHKDVLTGPRSDAHDLTPDHGDFDETNIDPRLLGTHSDGSNIAGTRKPGEAAVDIALEEAELQSDDQTTREAPTLGSKPSSRTGTIEVAVLSNDIDVPEDANEVLPNKIQMSVASDRSDTVKSEAADKRPEIIPSLTHGVELHSEKQAAEVESTAIEATGLQGAATSPHNRLTSSPSEQTAYCPPLTFKKTIAEQTFDFKLPNDPRDRKTEHHAPRAPSQPADFNFTSEGPWFFGFGADKTMPHPLKTHIEPSDFNFTTQGPMFLGFGANQAKKVLPQSEQSPSTEHAPNKEQEPSATSPSVKGKDSQLSSLLTNKFCYAMPGERCTARQCIGDPREYDHEGNYIGTHIQRFVPAGFVGNETQCKTKDTNEKKKARQKRLCYTCYKVMPKGPSYTPPTTKQNTQT